MLYEVEIIINERYNSVEIILYYFLLSLTIYPSLSIMKVVHLVAWSSVYA
jgi:hypothetical protein